MATDEEKILYTSLATFVAVNRSEEQLPKYKEDDEPEVSIGNMKSQWMPKQDKYPHAREREEIFGLHIPQYLKVLSWLLDSSATTDSAVACALDHSPPLESKRFSKVCLRIAVNNASPLQEARIVQHARTILKYISNQRIIRKGILALKKRSRRILKRFKSVPHSYDPRHREFRFIFKFWRPALLGIVDSDEIPELCLAMTKFMTAPIENPHLMLADHEDGEEVWQGWYGARDMKTGRQYVSRLFERHMRVLQEIRALMKEGHRVPTAAFSIMITSGRVYWPHVLDFVMLQITEQLDSGEFKEMDKKRILVHLNRLAAFFSCIYDLRKLRSQFHTWAKFLRPLRLPIKAEILPKTSAQPRHIPLLSLDALSKECLPKQAYKRYRAIQNQNQNLLQSTDMAIETVAQYRSQSGSKYETALSKTTAFYEHNLIRLTRFYIEHSSPALCTSDLPWAYKPMPELPRTKPFAPLSRYIGRSQGPCHGCTIFLSTLRNQRSIDAGMYGMTVPTYNWSKFHGWMPPPDEINARDREEALAWQLAYTRTFRELLCEMQYIVKREVGQYDPPVRPVGDPDKRRQRMLGNKRRRRNSSGVPEPSELKTTSQVENLYSNQFRRRADMGREVLRSKGMDVGRAGEIVFQPRPGSPHPSFSADDDAMDSDPDELSVQAGSSRRSPSPARSDSSDDNDEFANRLNRIRGMPAMRPEPASSSAPPSETDDGGSQRTMGKRKLRVLLPKPSSASPSSSSRASSPASPRPANASLPRSPSLSPSSPLSQGPSLSRSPSPPSRSMSPTLSRPTSPSLPRSSSLPPSPVRVPAQPPLRGQVPAGLGLMIQDGVRRESEEQERLARLIAMQRGIGGGVAMRRNSEAEAEEERGDGAERGEVTFGLVVERPPSRREERKTSVEVRELDEDVDMDVDEGVGGMDEGVGVGVGGLEQQREEDNEHEDEGKRPETPLSAL